MDKKYDTGKPMVGLMKLDFHLALIAVAEVTSYGVKKYNQPGSWRTVENAFERYEDALGRHDLQSTHEFHCEESGLTHLAHRAWNALATLQLMLEEREENLNQDVALKTKELIDVLNSKKIVPPVTPDQEHGYCSAHGEMHGDCYAESPSFTVSLDHDLVAESVTPLPSSVYTWVCSNCGVKNDNSNIYTCQRCGHRRC